MGGMLTVRRVLYACVLTFGLGASVSAAVKCEAGKAVVDGVVIVYGTTVDCVGECVEKRWQDISPSESDLKLVRINGRGNQDQAVIHLNGLPKGRELKPGKWYRVRGKLNDGKAEGSEVLFSMAVEGVDEVAAAPLGPGDFVDRKADLEGTASAGGLLKVGTSDVHVAEWPEKVTGKHVAVRGVVRQKDGSFSVEAPEWRLVNPEDMVGTTVKLEGLIWSMNDVFAFRYRGIDMIVTDAKDHPITWSTVGHAGAARVTGLLVKQLRPSLEQISLKEDRDLVPTFVIRRATIEHTEPEVSEREKFRDVYPEEYKVIDGVPELIAQDIVRRNIMGYETQSLRYTDFNRRVIESVLANATPATLEVLNKRMSDPKIETPLRLVYAAMLAAANDRRGREFLSEAVGRHDKDFESAVFCLGVFGSLMPEGSKVKTDVAWAEPVMVKLMSEKDERGRYVSARTVARVSDVPYVLARLDTPGARRALIEYAIANVDPPTHPFAPNVLRLIAEREMRVPHEDLMRLVKVVKAVADRRSILHIAVRQNDAAVVEMFLPELGDEEHEWLDSELEGKLSPEILKVVAAHQLDLRPKGQALVRRLLLVNQKDPVPDLIKALNDDAERDKNWVMWELAAMRDVRCVGPVLEILRRAPAKYFGEFEFDGMLGTQHAIGAVAAPGTRESISGLIDLLDMDLSRFKGFDREGGRRIAAARLIDLTGESFGTDAAAWRKWFGADAR